MVDRFGEPRRAGGGGTPYPRRMPDRAQDRPGRTVPGAVRLAALLAGLEGVALVGLGAFVAGKTAVQRPDSYGRALLGAAMAAAGGALLVLHGRALLRLRPWAR